MDGGAWWAAVHGVAKSRMRLSDFTFTFHFHALEKEMATHSSVLAWRIPGQPGGLPSMGSHRVGHDWGDLAAAAYQEILPNLLITYYLLLVLFALFHFLLTTTLGTNYFPMLYMRILVIRINNLSKNWKLGPSNAKTQSLNNMPYCSIW